jgi:glycosyltransferase involved in cell wall biosynthesis
MRFSIVIPTWEQHGKGVFFLNQLLTSIKEQTFTDFEVIVSDHSIEDEIKDLCLEFKDLNIRYFKNELNRGNSPANLNYGLKQAKGEIIKVMFQDDFFSENYSLEGIDATFKATLREWIVVGSCITTDSIKFSCHLIPDWNDGIPQGNNTIGSPSVLAFENKDILLFDEGLTMLMDCDYYYALYKKYGFPCIIEDCLVVSTSHEHQISSNYDGDLNTEKTIIKNKYI